VNLNAVKGTIMKVICKTNLDDYKQEKWPEEFCCRPMVGDKVRSKNGAQLHIVGITHAEYDVSKYDHTPSTMRPILLIELHKREAV
jgi:hypothetical protein